MRIKTLTLVALIAACTTPQSTPDKDPKPGPATEGTVAVGAQIDAFGAT